MNNDTTDNAPTVPFKKIRVLREALAHIGNHGDPFSRRRATVALGVWAKMIEEDCPHLQRVEVKNGTGGRVMKCIDCGDEK